MSGLPRWPGLVLGLAAVAVFCGCAEDNALDPITGPEGIKPGPGVAHLVSEVSFISPDLVEVAAMFAHGEAVEAPAPTVILIHDFARNHQQWFFTPLFLRLLERGYAILAIDLRGHGDTPLPEDDTPSMEVGDLENTYLDVFASLNWLKKQALVDPARIGLVGTGLGGNVAFVSIGVLSGIKTAVALSPGFWDADAQSLVVGSGHDPFEPRSVLFLVGEGNVFWTSSGDTLSSVDVATEMAGATNDPKSLRVFAGMDDFGLDMLCTAGAEDCNVEPEQLLLEWLETHL